MKDTTIPAKFTSAFPALHRAVYNKWYVDELYDFLFVNPCKALGNFLWKGFDVIVVDGIVDGVAKGKPSRSAMSWIGLAWTAIPRRPAGFAGRV